MGWGAIAKTAGARPEIDASEPATMLARHDLARHGGKYALVTTENRGIMN